MVHITSLITEKMQFNHFLIISILELSVAMATKPKSESFWIALNQATFVPDKSDILQL